MSLKLGIDVGGTNTDGAILDEQLNILKSFKVPTTEDIGSGIVSVIEKLLEDESIDRKQITHAMLGTTQCTNAIVTRKGLNKIALIRIGLPAGAAIEPLYSVPGDLEDKIGEYTYMVHGGHEYNGELISELDEEEIKRIGHEIKGNVTSVGITSIFSPVTDAHEIRTQEILEEILGEEVTFSLSSDIGSIGLLERENATALNAALQEIIKKTVGGFEQGLKENGVTSSVYFCQNDGTLMSKEYTLNYPVLTVACGPTNSLRGASYLSQSKDAVTVDVGGTTTDIGVLKNGFPRESSSSAEIGGVATNFRMPDIYSVALGGGTIITGDKNDFQIGPESVGHRLSQEALIFGGDQITFTDIAVAKGVLDIGDKTKVASLDKEFVSNVYDEAIAIIERSVERMKTSADKVQVVLVGGGSSLFNADFEGAKDVANPKNGSVANAIGAAISDVSGEIEKIYNVEPAEREQILNEIKQNAIDEAVRAGADLDSVEIISFEDIPLAYIPGNATKIKVKAAGILAN